MKYLNPVFIIFSLIIPFLLFSAAESIETAPRISDREIVERLTRLEEGQKSILREMDKRFEAMDSRFVSMEKNLDSRFETLERQLDRLSYIFIAIVAVVIGFAFWDRRISLKPAINRRTGTINILEGLKRQSSGLSRVSRAMCFKK